MVTQPVNTSGGSLGDTFLCESLCRMYIVLSRVPFKEIAKDLSAPPQGAEAKAKTEAKEKVGAGQISQGNEKPGESSQSK